MCGQHFKMSFNLSWYIQSSQSSVFTEQTRGEEVAAVSSMQAFLLVPNFFKSAILNNYYLCTFNNIKPPKHLTGYNTCNSHMSVKSYRCTYKKKEIELFALPFYGIKLFCFFFLLKPISRLALVVQNVGHNRVIKKYWLFSECKQCERGAAALSYMKRAPLISLISRKDPVKS